MRTRSMLIVRQKYWYLGSLFYPLTLTLFKTSVILLNKRIFVQDKFQKICWAVLVVNACWGLGNFLGACFQCIPMSTMWGGTDPDDAVCWNQDGLCMHCFESIIRSELTGHRDFAGDLGHQ